MKLGVLFSGGKDSCLAMQKAMENGEIVCLISILSKNRESYMFHTPNIGITKLQAQAIGLPLIQKTTKGEKELELRDLKKAIEEAKREFGIEGIVTGAIESVYQSSRIQGLCSELDLQVVNPLWKRDQKGLMEELIRERFDVVISGVFAESLGKEFLGKRIDRNVLAELEKLNRRYGISISGEGGEIETTVLDAPFFRKRLEIIESEINWMGDSGVFVIKKAELAVK